MQRLIETSVGWIEIDLAPNGSYGSIVTFGDDHWVEEERFFEGEEEIATTLETVGISHAEAARIAADYWSGFRARATTEFVSRYMKNARKFVWSVVLVFAVVAGAVAATVVLVVQHLA